MRNIWCVLVLGLTVFAGSGGAQELQRGTKTVPEHFVAYVAGESALPAARADVETALRALWSACRQAGLHPLGLPTLYVDVMGLDDGTLKWETRLPLVDKLDANKLPEFADMSVKLVPEGKVVYRFAAGEPWKAMESAFGDLMQWAKNQNLPMTSKARAIIYMGPLSNDPAEAVIEVQFELREP